MTRARSMTGCCWESRARSLSSSCTTCRPACAAGYWPRAARGELAVRLPVGLAYDAAGSVVLDPDTAVRKAVSHLFATFEQTGSATAVVRAFAAESLSFPARDCIGERAGP